MEAKAVGRYLRVTPRKARFVLDAVRGKSVGEALGILKFLPNEAAVYIRRILESAVANAEHNYAMDTDVLRLSTAFVDEGPRLKRIQPRAMGRAFRILKRTSHITLVVSEDESLKAKVVAAKPKGRRIVGRGRGAGEPVAAGSRGAAKGTKPQQKTPDTAIKPAGGATPSPESKEE
jgi:large subunit ribosomal protein L22